jgi:serine protease Do
MKIDEHQTRKLQRISIITLIAIVSAICGILFASKMNWTQSSFAEGDNALSGKYDALLQNGESPFVTVAELLKPAVVSIWVDKTSNIESPFDFYDFGPFRDFFNPPSKENLPRQKVRNGGTGIIISTDGHILTNNHIVEGADEITVKLSNENEYKAEVVGTDPVTDVALIKINEKVQDEQVARLGDSDKIKIGDWAIAIGNPFGLDWTVTVGVISAKGRGGLNIAGGGPAVQDFIQTDASINFGNSGGPLVNIRGEVIGVNTAINSQGQGIGFAIPINIAKEVVGQLRQSGKVSHGYLGMVPEELTPEKKEALELNPEIKGVFVDQVEDNTPASQSDLRPGDVITEFDGQKVSDVTQFRRLVASHRAGDVVTATIVREGKEKKLTFKLGDRAEIAAVSNQEPARSQAWLGIQVEDLNSSRARQWDLPENKGVLVVGIEKGSPAQDLLQKGDVIIEIDRRPIANVDDFNKISKELKDRKRGILFRISRNGRKTYEVIKP